MLDTTSTATLILLAAATTLLLTAMLYPSSFLRWLQRKRYQYEVTFSLYMLTPTEKFIFSTPISQTAEFLLPQTPLLQKLPFPSTLSRPESERAGV